MNGWVGVNSTPEWLICAISGTIDIDACRTESAGN
jgi:hypothetical protein